MYKDSTVRLWNYDMEEERVSSSKFKFHNDSITDLSLHPTHDFCLTTSKDKSWIFSDINKGDYFSKRCFGIDTGF